MIKYETCTYYSVQKKFEKIFRKIINGFEYAGYFKTFFNITIIFDGGKNFIIANVFWQDLQIWCEAKCGLGMERPV